MQRHRGHDDIVTSVCAGGIDNSLFSSVGADGIINNWSVEHEKPVSSSFISSGVCINAVANSPTTPFMSSTLSQDDFCRLWDSRQMNKGCVQIARLKQTGSAIAWSGLEESQCLVGMIDGQLALVDWRVSGTVEHQQLHNARINSIRMSNVCTSGGNKLIVSSSDDFTSTVSIEIAAPPGLAVKDNSNSKEFIRLVIDLSYFCHSVFNISHLTLPVCQVFIYSSFAQRFCF